MLFDFYYTDIANGITIHLYLHLSNYLGLVCGEKL